MIENKKPTEIKNKEEIINRKVAVYINSPSVSLFIELHAAVIRDLLSRNNKVTAYVCDESFKSPMDNPFNRKAIYRYGLFRAKDAIKGLDVKLKLINLDKITDKVPIEIAEKLEIGTMSSFASMLKAQNKEELSPKWLKAYNNMFLSAKKLYNYFLEEINKEGYEFIFLFNGRFGDARPALEAAKSSNIGFGLYETKIFSEVVFVNELRHSIEANTRRAIAFYEIDKEIAKKRAEDYFIKKEQNKYTGEPIYTKHQKKDNLPEEIKNTTKKIIAIYPTTEDEYKFIGKEWEGYVVKSQVEEIEKLAANLPAEEYILVIKMHPNQIFTAENTTDKYLTLAKKYPHVVVEKPLSKKDSYALMHKADVVVVFASSMGVEACYAGKPVVLIGDCLWSKLDIAHKVYSGKEAAELIKKGLKPKPPLGAIIWANYLMAYKDTLPDFQWLGKGNYLVSGRRIGRSVIRRILQLPAKLEIYVNSPGFRINKLFFQKIFFTISQIIKGR